MIRVLALILLLQTLLFSLSKESCYTIQLTSANYSEKNLSLLEKKEYPESCRIMKIGRSLTVRCECLDKFKEAKSALSNYTDKFKHASVATTYRSRFSKDAPKIVKPKKKLDRSATSKKDEELRLLVQVFLYQGDLKNAYRAASLGHKRYPNSYYWNEKMFEVSKWTNRSAESMKYLRNMYDIQRDPKAEEDLITYGVSSYQYEEVEPLVVNRARANPSEENIDLMLKVYRKLGYPEKVVGVLDDEYKKDPQNKLLLTKALELALEMGDLELAKKYVTLLEKEPPYSKKDATLIAKYYYVSRQIEKGYSALSHIKETQHDTKKDDKGYYEMKSDLGWYLQDNIPAAEASLYLMDHNESRLVDYERISIVYQKSNPKIAALATKRAYKEYKRSYLFYSYANTALNLKQYDDLREMIGEIDSEGSSDLLNQSLYWMIKAKLYAHYKLYTQEQGALSRAYNLEPDNMQIKLELLSFYVDRNNRAEIQNILQDMVENPKLKSSAYFPIASAYYNIGEIDRADYYVNELIAEDNPVKQLIDFQLLQAYIAQSRGNENRFKTIMMALEKQLLEESQKNSTLLHSDKYLSKYLRVAMYTLNAELFESRLASAKPYLKKKNYDEINYSWALRNSAKEKSLRIYHQIDQKELWMLFSNAMIFQKHTTIEDILTLYLHSISMSDATVAANQDGQVALAQSMSFENTLLNEQSQNAYIQHLSLSKKRSDLLDIKSSYNYREPLLQEYIKIKNSNYLQDGYFLQTDLFYAKNSSKDKNILVYVDEDTLSIGIGLRRLYNRGEITLQSRYHDEMEQYIEYSVSGKYRASTDIMIEGKIGKNMTTAESTQLLLGGKKDAVSLDLTWNILNSTSLSFHQAYNSYSSQDEVDLGDGLYSRILLARQFRSGYPDIRAGLFYDNGRYDETSGSRGVIDKLTQYPYTVLPANFYNIGITLSYGMMNSQVYTRVWRPYIEISPYYNSDLGDFTYGFNAGVGGKVFHQDHLSIGTSYTDSVNGVGGRILEIYLNYQFMYYHP